MAYLPRNTPNLFRQVGLTVVELPNWETRGRPASTGGFAPVGTLVHHTGAASRSWTAARAHSYADWMARVGRPDLPAPLANIGLGPDGTVYMLAAGRANHAGKAKPSGTVAGGDGNRLYIGIEAMNSGSEGWTLAQRAAYVKVCAVLCLDITKNSHNTVRGHKETSYTGKWDPGMLDMNAFRRDVALEMQLIKNARRGKPVEKPAVRLRIGHSSMQASDTVEQWRHDIRKIFGRKYEWITGTEAGESQNWAVIRAEAARTGYIVRRIRSNWIAVKRSIMRSGSFTWGSKIVAKAGDVYGPGHDSCFLWVTFRHKNRDLGKISVIASHFPTKGRPDGDAEYRKNLKWTQLMAKEIGAKARELGKGKALCFYGGDQNIVDQRNDTFFNEPLVTCWDELKKWPNTGHGNIDVIARYKHDGRVKFVKASAFTDKQFFLHSDHYLVEAVVQITPIA